MEIWTVVLALATIALVFATLGLTYFAWSTDRTYKSIDRTYKSMDATYKVIAEIASNLRLIFTAQTNIMEKQSGIIQEQTRLVGRQAEIAERQARALSALNEPIFSVRKEISSENGVRTECLSVENIGARVRYANVKLATVFEVQFRYEAHPLVRKLLGTRFYFPADSPSSQLPEIWRTMPSKFLSDTVPLQRYNDDRKIGVYSVALSLHHYIDVKYRSVDDMDGHRYFLDGKEISADDAKEGFEAVRGDPCFDFARVDGPLDLGRLWSELTKVAPP